MFSFELFLVHSQVVSVVYTLISIKQQLLSFRVQRPNLAVTFDFPGCCFVSNSKANDKAIYINYRGEFAPERAEPVEKGNIPSYTWTLRGDFSPPFTQKSFNFFLSLLYRPGHSLECTVLRLGNLLERKVAVVVEPKASGLDEGQAVNCLRHTF